MSIGRIPTVRLGTDGPEVSAQGFGCMGISFAYGPTDAEEARATLERAVELGVTHFDTADVYGREPGDNERFIAPFVRAHRDRVVLASKFSLVVDRETGERLIRNDRSHMRRCVEDSLRRLGVDALDVYYLHRRDVRRPIEETVGDMAELVQEGKVRHLGLSEVTADELRAAHAVHPIAALQSEWSLFSRDVERHVVGAAADLGVAFVAYSPLGRGFLTGSFTDASRELTAEDFRGGLPRFSGSNAERNAALLEDVRAVARAHDATPGQIALAWVHQRARRWNLNVVPIPGTRRRARVEENTAAVGIELSEAELASLEPIAGKVAGTRHADMSFTSAGRE
ncbi:aldo/keto reductase [Streptomyces sp. AJS327]|uniref:aldo/keto reductase n=1 Tax=Streptomyces sp. AJS327 TaxID=2545265 RepID=UPI0015DD7A34|nr:aldo/keto reductase [Streptomyces sp. AJS327]MBA0049992.1 aldo/keto reductase [Streptomyces sp. AJS327]